MRVEAREIDEIGTDGIIKKIWERVGKNPVYLSIDIDVLDPAYAPATGTPETGGWSTRELQRGRYFVVCSGRRRLADH